MIETKRRSTILNVVLTAIILVIGFLFWPGKEKFNQSNPRDVNKTNQEQYDDEDEPEWENDDVTNYTTRIEFQEIPKDLKEKAEKEIDKRGKVDVYNDKVLQTLNEGNSNINNNNNNNLNVNNNNSNEEILKFDESKGGNIFEQLENFLQLNDKNTNEKENDNNNFFDSYNNNNNNNKSNSNFNKNNNNNNVNNNLPFSSFNRNKRKNNYMYNNNNNNMNINNNNFNNFRRKSVQYYPHFNFLNFPIKNPTNFQNMNNPFMVNTNINNYNAFNNVRNISIPIQNNKQTKTQKKRNSFNIPVPNNLYYEDSYILDNLNSYLTDQTRCRQIQEKL